MKSDFEEKVKKVKEISDLKSEIEKTEGLLQKGQWNELSIHLQELQKKYCLETALYNLTHPDQPKSLQENAQNCLNFLSGLLASKCLELGNQK